MKKAIAALALTGLLTAAPASVMAKEGVNPWQECGIGAMIFPENGTAAALSNIIWDLGTTAVSSNISSDGSCAGANVDTAMFIQQTYPVLQQEVAQGEGEYLSAMLTVRGCSAEAHTALIENVRADYANATEVNAEGFYNILEAQVNSAQFNASCS